jgi:hypothetical protein
LVPTVDKVNKDGCSLGWEIVGQGCRNEAFKLAVGGVNEKIKASADGETELSFGEEEFGKGVGIGDGENGARKAAPGSANADGAEFVEVVLVFMKGKKAAKGKWSGDARWYVIVEEQAEDFGQGLKAGV